ncbi:hypothetical protein PMAYCL1PPCAC_09632, partial [Pristionchus mayeri]
ISSQGMESFHLKRTLLRKNEHRILTPIITGTLITIILSINLRNALPDMKYTPRAVSATSNIKSEPNETCNELARLISKRRRIGDSLKWFWDTRVRPALKTTLKCLLRFSGHTEVNADATVEWISDQLHYLAHTRKYRLLARFVERRIAYVITNLPILLRDGFKSDCFVPLFVNETAVLA